MCVCVVVVVVVLFCFAVFFYVQSVRTAISELRVNQRINRHHGQVNRSASVNENNGSSIKQHEPCDVRPGSNMADPRFGCY